MAQDISDLARLYAKVYDAERMAPRALTVIETQARLIHWLAIRVASLEARVGMQAGPIPELPTLEQLERLRT